ncbi:MAG: L-threonylcarbamoyladenylate synthase [Candidatus Eisenbacteria bacterium]|nr:L-threonylcarbamoyladenylate synthase [Candidatus Eisenbacteria bacterium]
MREIDLTARSDESTRELLAPAVRALKDGSLVILPTTTYYALSADATNPDAVQRVFSAKKRKPSKPLVVLVDSLGMMKQFVSEIPAAVKDLEWKLGSKGLSYVLRASDRLPTEVTAGTGTVAVRVERNEVVLEVLSQLAAPIVAPSANIEGAEPPRRIEEAIAPLRDWIEVAVRWYAATATAASTIVDLTGDAFSVIREGTVPAADVSQVLGE